MFDIFVRDRRARRTERVSVSVGDLRGEGGFISGSRRPAISADGRFIAFESGYTNLVPGDTNDGRDIFVRSR